jgi:creatinine amidohydrolase
MIAPATQFEDNDPELSPDERSHWIAVLPLGAHEQHGPHLPFDTDTLIAQGIVSRLKVALPKTLPVTFLPTEPVGYSIEHMDVTGTQTLGYGEAIERWLGIAEMLSQQGIRKFVMLNAHGGNSPLLTVVATEARVRFDMLAVATSWTRFGLPAGIITPEEKAIDIHGGDIETSVMLALHPDAGGYVESRELPLQPIRLRRPLQTPARLRPARLRLENVRPQRPGRAGNAARATAEKGEALIGHAVAGLVELLADVDAFDVGVLR